MPRGVRYKIKQQPDDFQVEEITRVVPGPDGPFALYRLEKSGWTTTGALDVIRRRWGIEPRRLSYGGLKDRHALTVQYLTIFRGPRRRLRQQGIHVEYCGQTAAPYTSQDIARNRFCLTVRDLAIDCRAELEEELARVAVEGVPNYFDDQRFGSVPGRTTGNGEFVARMLVLGRFEDALRLALVAPYEHDRVADKKEKRLLVAHWGDWALLKEKLPRGHAKRLVDYLRLHPTDFRGAVTRLRPALRTLYMAAYQSHLWNRLLAAWLRQHLAPDQLRPTTLRLGEVPFHIRLDTDQRLLLSRLSLPLLSARLKLAADDPRAGLISEILNEEGLQIGDLQVRGIREMFFSKGERPALCIPQDLTHRFAEDEVHAGRHKLQLTFDLPRGSYATLVIKRLFG
jgi:tRNA pseudouridine13 synthase